MLCISAAVCAGWVTQLWASRVASPLQVLVLRILPQTFQGCCLSLARLHCRIELLRHGGASVLKRWFHEEPD
jgi:hypothetical protein